jgi:hypothetical protein
MLLVEGPRQLSLHAAIATLCLRLSDSPLFRLHAEVGPKVRSKA